MQLTDDVFNFTSARPAGVVEIDDLAPVEVAVAAAQRYAQEFLVHHGTGISLQARMWTAATVCFKA